MLALEVVSIAVTDVDRALDFYVKKAGFALDVDYQPTTSFRVIQLTPPGSACSIHLVKANNAGQMKDLVLVTDDLVRERERLIARGVAVEGIRRKDPLSTWSGNWADGIDPLRSDYASFADFTDPDGNRWTIQERGFR